MTARDFAQRLHARARAGGGWLARCPAHEDRRPSLTIAEGRDGRVLLRCWTGCETKDIVRAMGLRFEDLFVDAKTPDEYSSERRRFREAPRETIESFLQREIERQRTLRLERDPDDVAAVRARDINRARSRANEIFGTRLRSVPDAWWECCAPHDRDPLWPLCLQRAAYEVRIERLPGDSKPPREEVEGRAAFILSEFARADMAAGAQAA